MNFVNGWKASMSMGYCQSVQMAFELARCARWNVQIKSPKWATLSNFTVKRLTTKWCGLRRMIEIVNPSVTVSAIFKFKDVSCDFHHWGYTLNQLAKQKKIQFYVWFSDYARIAKDCSIIQLYLKSITAFWHAET